MTGSFSDLISDQVNAESRNVVVCFERIPSPLVKSGQNIANIS